MNVLMSFRCDEKHFTAGMYGEVYVRVIRPSQPDTRFISCSDASPRGPHLLKVLSEPILLAQEFPGSHDRVSRQSV